MPNFEPFNSKLRELEGVKIFHKTGSGTKSRPKFKNRFHPKCAEKWAATCCKVSGQSNARKMLGETFKFSRDPQGGATRRKAEDGKLLCISELTSNGVDGARTLKLLYTWRIRSRSEPGQIGERRDKRKPAIRRAELFARNPAFCLRCLGQVLWCLGHV